MKSYLKILIALTAISLLFYFNIVSIDALEIFVKNLNIFYLIQLVALTFLLVIGTYYRWFLCSYFLGITIPKKGFINISSEAYTLGQIVPGQLGIDGWRILRLKDTDNSRYKSKLITATIIEKVISILSQLALFFLFLLFFLELKISIIKLVMLFLCIIFSVITVLFLIKYTLNKKLNIQIQKKDFNLFIKISCLALSLNLVACTLIYLITNIILENHNINFLNTSIAMLISNISAAIPITPNGIGLSEFLYSKTISVIASNDKSAMYGTSYLIYRILNIFGHFFMYLISTINFKNFRQH